MENRFQNPRLMPYAGYDREEWERGITPRDWFAGQALAGLCAEQAPVRPEYVAPGKSAEDAYAKQAYLLANAMLAERQREE